MSEIDRERDLVEPGLRRLRRLADRLDPELIDAIGGADFADRAAGQPWLIAGVSDGMGLQTTLAALEAGVLNDGVGVYWEPSMLLELEDGEPVSPVHWARYQNAEALERFAAERGGDLEVLSADMILAPNRGVKGDPKGEIPDFPEAVREAFAAARQSATRDDAVFIDSVAFGKWICPREGDEPVEVPSVDEEGRVVRTSTKKYHPRGYQETLDTMGRNHSRLLEQLREFGWLGPDAVTAFFTWAGGSQNVGVLEGIYGRGSLGDAKIVAERDVVEFRLEHGRDLGDHAIVRFPAFLSAALLAIPGGALFGLISQRVLERRGVYREMPELAARMLRRLFGSEWVRSNPIAQIELDSAESLYMSEIRSAVEEAHRRIAAHRENQPEEARREPIPLQQSRELLAGLAPPDYPDILRRFRPEEQLDANDPETDAARTFDVGPQFAPDGVEAPRAALLAAAVPTAEPALADVTDDLGAATVRDTVAFERGRWTDPAEMSAQFTRSRADGGPVVERRFLDAEGREVARAETRVATGPDSSTGAADEGGRTDLGRPVGAAIELEGGLARRYWPRAAGEGVLWSVAGLVAFAESALWSEGVIDPEAPSRTLRFDFVRAPEPGDRLVTYLQRDGDGAALRGVVVGRDGDARLRFAESSP